MPVENRWDSRMLLRGFARFRMRILQSNQVSSCNRCKVAASRAHEFCLRHDGRIGGTPWTANPLVKYTGCRGFGPELDHLSS